MSEKPSDRRPTVRNPPVIPETAVRKSIRDWLDLQHIPHIPVEARKPLRMPDGSVFFVNEREEDKGIADIIAFRQRGWIGSTGEHICAPIAIEVKRSRGGVQSDAQKAFQARWEAWGFQYILAPSLEVVIAQWPRRR